MRTNFLTPFILVMVITGSCSEDNTQPDGIEPLIVAQGELYGNGKEEISAQNLIIEEDSTWNALRNQMNTVNNESGNFSETTIDFTSFQVIAFFDKIRSSGGYSLAVNIQLQDGARIVEVIHHFPDGVATTVITQPYLIVRIPISELPIQFQ